MFSLPLLFPVDDQPLAEIKGFTLSLELSFSPLLLAAGTGGRVGVIARELSGGAQRGVERPPDGHGHDQRYSHVHGELGVKGLRQPWTFSYTW